MDRYASIAPEGSLAWLSQPLPRTFRVNMLKASAPEALELLASDGIQAQPAPWHRDAFVALSSDGDRHALGNSLAHFLGLIYVQDLPSLLPVLALEPALRPESAVLDACAAPGSKTTQLAAALQNRGCVVANDSDWQRIKALKSNLERLGALNVVVTNLDFSRFPAPSFSAVGSKKLHQEGFESILLDAPCSSEGTVRKHANAATQPRRPPPASLARLQQRLLRRAFQLLSPGGTLLYSTCTLAPEENELVVASLLAAEPTASLEAFSLEGVPLSPGVTAWEGTALPEELAHTRRLWPGPQWGGFFLAKLRKEA